jgi:hypothetical protein
VTRKEILKLLKSGIKDTISDLKNIETIEGEYYE